MTYNDSSMAFLQLIFIDGWHHVTRHWRSKQPGGPRVMIGTAKDTVPEYILYHVYLDYCAWHRSAPLSPTHLAHDMKELYGEKVTRTYQTINGLKEPVYIGIPLYVDPAPRGSEYDAASPYVEPYYALPGYVGDFARAVARDGFVEFCAKLHPPLHNTTAPDGAVLVKSLREAYARFCHYECYPQVPPSELRKAFINAYGHPESRHYGTGYMNVYPGVPTEPQP